MKYFPMIFSFRFPNNTIKLVLSPTEVFLQVEMDLYINLPTARSHATFIVPHEDPLSLKNEGLNCSYLPSRSLFILASGQG